MPEAGSVPSEDSEGELCAVDSEVAGSETLESSPLSLRGAGGEDEQEQGGEGERDPRGSGEHPEMLANDP